MTYQIGLIEQLTNTGFFLAQNGSLASDYTHIMYQCDILEAFLTIFDKSRVKKTRHQISVTTGISLEIAATSYDTKLNMGLASISSYLHVLNTLTLLSFH